MKQCLRHEETTVWAVRRRSSECVMRKIDVNIIFYDDVGRKCNKFNTHIHVTTNTDAKKKSMYFSSVCGKKPISMQMYTLRIALRQQFSLVTIVNEGVLFLDLLRNYYDL